MGYKIVNKNGIPLGGFFPNDIPDVFKFSNNNFFSFRTKKEGEGFIKRIKREIRDRDNKQRWGNELSSKYNRIANELKVMDR